MSTPRNTNSWLKQEAQSVCNREGYKLYPVPERGGSYKSPPQAKIGYVRAGKTYIGKKLYSQEDGSIGSKISELYISYYRSFMNQTLKEVEEIVSPLQVINNQITLF